MMTCRWKKALDEGFERGVRWHVRELEAVPNSAYKILLSDW